MQWRRARAARFGIGCVVAPKPTSQHVRVLASPLRWAELPQRKRPRPQSCPSDPQKAEESIYWGPTYHLLAGVRCPAKGLVW